MAHQLFDLDSIIESLKQQKDEIKLQIHLAGAEARDEWPELEKNSKSSDTKQKRYAKRRTTHRITCLKRPNLLPKKSSTGLIAYVKSCKRLVKIG